METHLSKTVQLAREAGMTGLEAGGLFDNFLVFEALVRADEREIEREACAKVCDDLAPPCGYNLTEISFWDVTSLECAAAIRARSKHD